MVWIPSDMRKALLDSDQVIPKLKAALQDQESILDQDMDYVTLASALLRLSCIQSFKLHIEGWLDGLQELIRYRHVVDVIVSSQRHISASLQALSRARKADIAIQKFSVEGLYLVQNVTSPDQRSINDVSLSDVSELRLQCESINYYLKTDDPHPLGAGYRLLTENASSTLQLLSLEFNDEEIPILDPISESCLFVTICSGLVFPRLRSLSLSNFVLPLKLFEQFSRNHAERNLVLDLSHVEFWFPPATTEGDNSLGLRDSEMPSESLLQCLAGIGKVANFKAVTIYGERLEWPSYADWHLNTAPLEKLLMGEIEWRDVTPAMLVIRH
jgi:hypothetical protein